MRELESFAIAARNLAIAQKQGDEDLVAICNACYTTLAKTNRYIEREPRGLHEAVNEALGAVGRRYDGNKAVRHIMDVLVNDVGHRGPRARRSRGASRAQGRALLRLPVLAPHGRLRRPRVPDHHGHACSRRSAPTSSDYPCKTKCCGGMMMLTKEEGALRLCHELLKGAQKAGADVIVCACPLCEMNLEGYQPRVNKTFGTDFNIPVMYFTQLAGLAFGRQSQGPRARQANRLL